MATLNDFISELETTAQQTCKTAGRSHNDGKTFTSRNLLEMILNKSEKPSQGDRDQIAFQLIDYYTNEDLNPHEHGLNNELVVSSIQQQWVRKGISLISTRVESMWVELNESKQVLTKKVSKQEALAVSENKSLAEGGTFKDRLLDNGKKAVARALVRKASRNLTEVSQHLITNMLLSNGNVEDPGLKEKVGQFLQTDFGKGLTAAALSLVLDSVPIPGLSEENKAALISELQTEAVDSFTLPVENAVKLMVPLLSGAVSPLLTSGSSTDTTGASEGNKQMEEEAASANGKSAH